MLAMRDRLRRTARPGPVRFPYGDEKCSLHIKSTTKVPDRPSENCRVDIPVAYSKRCAGEGWYIVDPLVHFRTLSLVRTYSRCREVDLRECRRQRHKARY